jgi:hypothetical protein
VTNYAVRIEAIGGIVWFQVAFRQGEKRGSLNHAHTLLKKAPEGYFSGAHVCARSGQDSNPRHLVPTTRTVAFLVTFRHCPRNQSVPMTPTDVAQRRHWRTQLPGTHVSRPVLPDFLGPSWH